MTAFLFTLFLTLVPTPSPAWNETNEGYYERVFIISYAIDSVTNSHRDLSVAIAVILWGESRLSPYIHAGSKLGDNGHAICLGQQHQNKRSLKEWQNLAGTDYESTRRCVKAVSETLISSYWYCNGLSNQWGWPEAMVLYGTGRTCRAEETQWKNIFKDRANKWEKYRRNNSHD